MTSTAIGARIQSNRCKAFCGECQRGGMDDVIMTGPSHTFTTPQRRGAPKIQLSVPPTVGQPGARETYRNAIFLV